MSVNKYLTKSGKKKWYVNIYISQDQDRIRKYGFDKMSEAKSYEFIYMTKMKSLKDSVYTLGAVFEVMMSNKAESDKPLTKSTVKNYRSEFGYLFTSKSKINPKTRLINIKAEELQYVLDNRTKNSKGERSLKFLKMFFKYIFEEKYTDSDLGARLHLKSNIKKSKKVQEHEKLLAKKRKWLDDKENLEFQKRLRSMENKVMNRMDKMQLLLALDIGLRDAETRGLEMRDIKYNGDITEVRIARQYTPDNEYTKTKNKKVRTVPVSKKVSEELTDYINNYKTSLYASKGWKMTEKSPLFTKNSKEELPIPHAHTNDILRKFFRHNEDINHVTSHGLRHSFASYLYNTNELPIRDISKLLGHANENTTLKYYIHTFTIKEDEVKNKLNAINKKYKE